MTIKNSFLLTTLPLLMLGGCIKEDYKDPATFAKKYIRADLERRFPRELWDELQYDDVELINVTSKMKETYSGARNEISCQVRLVPERGVKHYRRVDLRCDFAWGLGSLSRGGKIPAQGSLPDIGQDGPGHAQKEAVARFAGELGRA